METKRIIDVLRETNIWRRGWHFKMPDVKTFWIAIDEAIKLLENIDNKHNILITSFNELSFSNIQKNHYLTLLNEVEELLKKWVKNNLIQKVIENWKEKARLDNSIHFDINVWIDKSKLK